ncbi:MAG: hypothetical protein PXX73_08585 [Sideroxydans sp.]|nr:hypothetical protein [Sideroxydans sp.]
MMRTNHFSSPAQQQGSTLLISLIALVSMMLAGIALMRSVDTANVVAGNFAFKEASLQAADIAMEAAFTALPGLAATGNVPVANQYYAVMQPVDIKGSPTSVTWSAVPVINTSIAGYSVQYVIERMCAGSVTDPINGPAPGNIAEQTKYCTTLANAGSEGGSRATGHVTFRGNGVVYYRVTVRSTGPHNAVSMVQGTISL